MLIYIALARFRSPIDVAVYTAIIVLGFAGIWAYPMIKSEFIGEKKAKANRNRKKASSLDPIWNDIPTKESIMQFYPNLLRCLSENDLVELQDKLSDRFIQNYLWQFDKWKKQKIAYSFVWIDIELVEIIGIIDEYNNQEDLVKILVSGQSVDYMRELGTTTAMGLNTRKKKEFQDVLVFKRNKNTWLLNEIKKDAWFWQL